MTTQPFSVLCDRCRAEGFAGEAGFAELAGLGDLLDFEPVPRRVDRAHGWSAEVQRAFVAALAVTGSDRQAAAIVDRAAYGAARLREAEGSEGFVAACDKAIEIFHEKERVRRSDGLLAAARGEAARRAPGRPSLVRPLPPPQAPDPDGADPDERDRSDREFILALLKKHDVKVAQERRARLEGRIVEADFYVRQITWLEVAIDLGSGDGFAVFAALRAGEYDLVNVVETPMSRLFAAARRLRWNEAGEADRPECPTRQKLRDHGGFTTQDGEFWSSGTDPRDPAQWDRETKAEYEAAARAQAEWEEQSRKAAEAWREREEGRLAAAGPAPAGGGEEGPRGAAGEGEGAEGEGAGEGGGPEEPPVGGTAGR
ncbi:MAG TPA: hypothetical protein VF759_04590 [Allosphingosinicella sp.]